MSSGVFDGWTQSPVADDPQLGFGDSFDHTRPCFDHFAMTLVILASVEASDHEDSRGNRWLRRSVSQSRPGAEVDGYVWHALKAWIAFQKAVPCVIAVGKNEAH